MITRKELRNSPQNAEKQKPEKLPSERGRNYTILREVVHCALRTADDFRRFSISAEEASP